jgi:lipoyl(octanoyl) transferase
MILDLGLIDFDEAYDIQRDLVERRKTGELTDTLVLAEHPPVFTIGRTGNIKNLLNTGSGIRTIRTDRGGDITYHGPGQLIAYPIVDLRFLGLDMHSYLRLLESVGMAFFEKYGVRAAKRPGMTGIWTGAKKIASIGISASAWVSFHGMSINLNVDLSFFSMINPCGMRGMEVTSLESMLEKKISMQEAKARLAASFCRSIDFGGSGIVDTKYESAMA